MSSLSPNGQWGFSPWLPLMGLLHLKLLFHQSLQYAWTLLINISSDNGLVPNNALENVVCNMATILPGVGVIKPISSIPLYSNFCSIVKTHLRYWISRWHLSNMNVIQRIQKVLSQDQNTCSILYIKLIFDRCHHSSAAGTPVKYDCDSKNLKLLLQENFAYQEINKQSFSNPTPGGRLNKKDGLTRYGNSHVKDKTS